MTWFEVVWGLALAASAVGCFNCDSHDGRTIMAGAAAIIGILLVFGPTISIAAFR